MEVSGLLHAPTVLTPGYLLDRRLGGPQSRFGLGNGRGKTNTFARNSFVSLFLCGSVIGALVRVFEGFCSKTRKEVNIIIHRTNYRENKVSVSGFLWHGIIYGCELNNQFILHWGRN